MSKHNAQRDTAIAVIEAGQDATLELSTGMCIEVTDTAHMGHIPRLSFPYNYYNASELRRASKFLKALADSIERRFPDKA